MSILVISNNNRFRVLFDKIARVCLTLDKMKGQVEKYINILAL